MAEFEDDCLDGNIFISLVSQASPSYTRLARETTSYYSLQLAIPIMLSLVVLIIGEGDKGRPSWPD